ncbi:MAG TPA: hypothetical protein VL995_16005 [Cellvibrio sp.]|nr:hypothetical protein [Cellvibrio sp.]
MNNFKYILFGAAILGLAGIGLYNFQVTSSSSERSVIERDKNIEELALPPTDHAIPQSVVVPKAAEWRADGASAPSEPWNSPHGYEEVVTWREQHGYFSQSDMQTYKAYGMDTLENLANDGDLKAIHALAELKVKEGDVEKVRDVYLRGAVLGSTAALSMAGRITRPHLDMSKYQRDGGEKRFRLDMLEALSLLEVALIRGDRGESVSEQLREMKKEISLTQEDEETINKRAAEIYSDLESKRYAIGLGPFDNNVPSKVDDYFDAEQKGFINP